MQRMINATTGRTTSIEYIKNRLFDMMASDYFAEIDGVPANEVADRVKALRPSYDVDDVMDLMYDEGITFIDALIQLESDLEDM